jgi:vitamin B12 transporter
MKTLPFRPAAALAPMLLLSCPLSAAVQDVTSLDPVVVTAARTAVPAAQTPASVSIVSRAEIERRQSRSMIDVLRGLPGVAISSNGGPGQVTGVSLRGTPSDHVLVLIDGVRANSATVGGMRWQDLPVEQIERVEVVRGPRSSLYGSEAIGGVIQIFTRKGQGGPLRPRFTAGAGSDQTVSGSLGASGGVATEAGEGWFDAGIGFERTDGFNACRGEPFVGGCFVDQPDKDGYDNGNGSVRAGWRFSERLAVDVNFLRSEGQLEYDGGSFAGDESRSVVQVLGVKLDALPLAAWRTTLSASRSRDESEFFFDDRFLNRFDSRRDQLGWLNDFELAPSHRLMLGVDYYRDEIDTVPVYARTSRDNTGVFGQYLGRLGRHDLQASLRHDDNQQFGGHTTGDLAWGYHLGDTLSLSASYGTAFKAPSFNELYFPGFGNPGLAPESSSSIELGLSGVQPLGGWSLNVYQTEIDDLIAFDAASMMPANIAEARIRGVELRADAVIADWLLDASMTLLDPRDRSGGANDGNLLARQPEQTFRLDADRDLGRFSVGGTLFVSGRRYDDLANNVRLDGFSLLDLRAEYAFSRSLRLQARLSNVLDEDYETAAFYNQAGRSVLVTLRYAP